MTSPFEGSVSPTRTRSNVLLPEPDGPMRLTTSPLSACSVTPLSTSTEPYAQDRLRISSCGKTFLQVGGEAAKWVGQCKIADKNGTETKNRRKAAIDEHFSGKRQFNYAELRRQ